MISPYILDAMYKLGPIPHPDTFPFSYAGIRITEEPLPPPKLKLCDELDVSDEFRREYNAWLLELFGRHESMLGRDKALMMRDYGVAVVPHGMTSVLSSIGV